MIDPIISEQDAEEILVLFAKINSRNVLPTEDELNDPEREAFDRKVLQSIGHEDLYNSIRKSLLSMQYTRHSIG